jgi:hypothetical protein
MYCLLKLAFRSVNALTLESGGHEFDPLIDKVFLAQFHFSARIKKTR